MPKIKLEKVVRAERSKVFSTATDFENYPRMLPNYFNSVRMVSKEDNSITTEESIRVGARDITQTTKHTLKPPERHEAFVISGDAKDSHIVETYESAAEGTKITIEGSIKLGGKLKMLGFFAKGKLEKRLENITDEFARIAEAE